MCTRSPRACAVFNMFPVCTQPFRNPTPHALKQQPPPPPPLHADVDAPLGRLQARLHFEQEARAAVPSPAPTPDSHKRQRVTSPGPSRGQPRPDLGRLSHVTFAVFGAGVALPFPLPQSSPSVVEAPGQSRAGSDARGGAGPRPSILTTLPDVLLLRVLDFAAPLDVGRLCSTCRPMAALCVAEGPVWQRAWSVMWGGCARAWDAHTWYGSLRNALLFHRLYTTAPVASDVGAGEASSCPTAPPPPMLVAATGGGAGSARAGVAGGGAGVAPVPQVPLVPPALPPAAGAGAGMMRPGDPTVRDPVSGAAAAVHASPVLRPVAPPLAALAGFALEGGGVGVGARGWGAGEGAPAPASAPGPGPLLHRSVTCLMAVGPSLMALGWSDGTLTLVSSEAGVQSAWLRGGSIRHIQLHGGELFVCCWAGVVHVVDVSTLASSVVVADLPTSMQALQMTGDMLLLSCGDGSVLVFRLLHDPGTGAISARRLQVLTDRGGAIQDLQCDGDVLVTAGVDRTVRCVCAHAPRGFVCAWRQGRCAVTSGRVAKPCGRVLLLR